MSQTWEPERIVTIDDALKLEWYAGDTIVAYVLYEMTPGVLESWSEAALDVLGNWPAGKPYLALYDLSHKGVVISYSNLAQKRMVSLGITEAGEKETLNIIAQEGFAARIALYASMRHSGYLGGLFAKVDVQTAPFSATTRGEVFHDREAALNWLKRA